MSRNRKFLFITIWILAGFPILFLSFDLATYGQTTKIKTSYIPGGVLNTVLARINSVGFNSSNGDTLFVNSTTGFGTGDTVLIHMSVGAEFYLAPPRFEGKINGEANTGKYAIFILKEVNAVSKFLILNYTLPAFDPMLGGEYGQVIKVPTYERAIIKGTLTCLPFDTTSKTGGILVMMVKQGLVFEADINVSGKGFPGAKPDPVAYSGDCSLTDPLYLKPYYPESDAKYSALKGYSFSNTFIGLTRGNGAANNGGGGGNGKFSGGGGGANFGDGGKGGKEGASCGGIAKDIGGRGGKAPTSIYYEQDNRITFGGGGGTSAQDASHVASAGGNGGGIVIIVCDSLIGNGSRNIYAHGDSVKVLATAGGGGGGGGGTIILHVNKYSNSPKLWVKGGKGGSIDPLAPFSCGPGGGGGGGAIWFNGISLGSLVSTSDGKNGTPKDISDPLLYGASSGSFGDTIRNLVIPIRGFITNFIPPADTICKLSPPKIINAAPSIGAGGLYKYRWLQSLKTYGWIDAEGLNNLPTYTPPAYIDTTMYYRRYVVTTDSLIRDSSNIVEMVVLPLLRNNVISPADTTVCANLNAGTLYALNKITGGNGSYQYSWERSNNASFGTPAIVGNSTSIVTPVFTADAWFRRKVVSSACKNTSDSVRIRVLPVIANNNIDSSQEICTKRTPEILTGNPALSGGNNLYRYKWQKETGPSVWSDLLGDTLASYQSPEIIATGTHSYRRFVYSGPGNTCQDYSDTVIITVMPDIKNDTLYPITQSVLCSGLDGEILNASDVTMLTGGDGVYSYFWQKDGINAPGGDVITGFKPGILTADATFRRKVSSGTNKNVAQRCWSTSNERKIFVLENITNNNLSVSKAPNTWCEGTKPEDITGTLPLNGDSLYHYSWQSKLPGNNWISIPDTTITLNTPAIVSSVDYRRIVISGLLETCKDTSALITFTMQNRILNNSINSDLAVSVCFDQDSILKATSFPGTLSGGDEANYSYLWLQSNALSSPFPPATQLGNTNALYLTEPIQTARFYKRRVISGECTDTSYAVKVEPLLLPELKKLQADRADMCFKFSSFLKIGIQSGTSPYLVTFNDGQGFNDSRTFTSGADSIQPLINNPSLTPGYIDYNYTISSIEDSKHCFAKKVTNLDLFSAPIRVYAKPMPESITGQSDRVMEICADSLQISVKPSIGVGSWHLKNVTGISADATTNPIINLTADFTSLFRASATLAYVENISNCPSDTIKVDAVLYNNPDVIKNIYRVVDTKEILVGDTVTIFIIDNQHFKADAVVSGIPGWRINSGSGTLSDPTLLTTEINGLKQDDPSFMEYSISNGICPVNSRTIKIERRELLIYDGFSPNNDNINDELWAVGLADEEVNFTFQVFSSSGSFMQEITRKDIKVTDLENNQIVLWDGTTKLGGAGNYISDGTYYYVLTLTYHGEKFDKRGYLVVKR